MRTKQEIAAAANKLVDAFSNPDVFGLKELAEMVRDLTEVAASDTDHGDARYLHEIAARVGFGVMRWHDLFQLSRDGVAMFSGTNRAAVGFILGWERSRVDSNQSDVKIASIVEAAEIDVAASSIDGSSSRSASRDVDHGVEYLHAVIAVLRADVEELEAERDALKKEARGSRVASREIACRDDLLKVVLAARLKHGPGGKGGVGPCDPDCLKCAVEVYRCRKDL